MYVGIAEVVWNKNATLDSSFYPKTIFKFKHRGNNSYTFTAHDKPPCYAHIFFIKRLDILKAPFVKYLDRKNSQRIIIESADYLTTSY